MTDTTEPVVDTTVPDAIAPETTEQVEQVQAESSPAVTDADESSEPKPKGVQKRIDELTRLRHEAQRERDHWRELAMRQQAPAKQEAPQADKPKALPKLEDFNYDEAAYQAALITHATQEASRKVREELRAEEAERQKAERAKSWKTRENEFKAKNPDYEDVVYTAPISDAMADLIMESEIGAELAYYLGKNTDEASRIAQLDPVKAARELGRIEAKLEKPPAAPVAPRPPPVSKAPPPPPRIEATESAAPIRADSPDSDKLSDAEWMRLRNKQVARKKG
jgi:hypothetical protein